MRTIPAVNPSTVIKNSNFSNCEALSGGAVVLYGSNTIISNSSFNNNSAKWGGGALYAYLSTLSLALSTLSHNYAYQFQKTTYGGGMYIGKYSSVSIKETVLTGNYANGYGGAIFSAPSSILNVWDSRFEDNYVHNQIDSGSEYGGGALSLSGDSYVFVNSVFVRNRAIQGGAIFNYYGNLIRIKSCIFEGNIAWRNGGALSSCELCVVVLEETSFVGNTANVGGAIFAQGSKLIGKRHVTFKNNSCESLGVAYLHHCDATFSGEWIFINNTGSLFCFATGVTFNSKTLFVNNRQPALYSSNEGGAVTLIQSTATFNGTVRMSNNQAKNGGALLISNSKVYATIYTHLELSDNTATHSGGAIHCFQCQLLFGALILITGNHASQNGGGLHITSSTINIIANHMALSQNNAKYGGGIYMQKNSMIVIKKNTPQILPRYFLEFSGNAADYGGAVYVRDDTNSGVCASNSTASSEGNCFLQTLRLYSSLSSDIHPVLKSTSFTNNTARYRGSSVYGGLLDRCSMSIFSELLDSPSAPLAAHSALSALSLTADIDEQRPVASDPVRVCFCENSTSAIINCHATHPAIYVKRGYSFKLSLVAVDQALNPLPANILASVSSVAGLREGQLNQTIPGECTEMKYNIFSQNDFEEMTIYAEGPCMSQGLSQHKIEIIFEPCTCAVGFQPSNSSGVCKCVCDQRLYPFITNCTSNQTINKEKDLWVSYSNETNTNGFLIFEFCPYDYCKSTLQGPVSIDLNTPNGADQQCALNRSGRLCGSCLEGYSLTLGSSKCLKCTNSYLALLVPFALAGVFLVIFLLVCNLTVATGSINGLILYANIVIANRSMFLPDKVPVVLSVFVAWMNLDLGIETCFYNGMSMYAKSLLQLVFPAYVLALVVALVVVSEHSKKFAALIGKKNPVATLATLILLSYTKFLRIIITGLSFGHLELPDGSWETVWLPDANELFLAKEQTPRFIGVSLVTIAGLLYVLLLLFEKCSRKCSKYKGLKCLNSTKLHAFMDAYYAPFNPQHCYWVGLLLLMRVVLYMHTVGFNSEPTLKHKATLLAIIAAVFFLLLLKQTKIRIHKSWVIDLLETSFLINLGVFAAGTYHLLSTNARGKQFILACVSVSIALLTFLIICAYHTWAYVVPNSCVKFFCRLKSSLLRRRSQSSTSDCIESSMPESTPYVSMGETQSYDTQTNATTCSLLREPDLDILAPVTKRDRQQQVKQLPKPKVTTCTFSVIEGRPPRQTDQGDIITLNTLEHH